LFHYSRYKQATYTVGDVIGFRIKGSNDKHSWQITGITDSTIVSGANVISPRNVSHFYVDRKSRTFFPLRNQYFKFLVAGVGYFFIDWVNSGEIDKSTVIVSGSLIGAAVLCKIFVKDYIKLEGKRKLVILR